MIRQKSQETDRKASRFELKMPRQLLVRTPWLLRYRKGKIGPLLFTVLHTVRDRTAWDRGRASSGQTMAKGHRQANV